MTGSSDPPIYGPEPWRTKRKAVWSHWDLWFCVVALADHDGDLEKLAVAIEGTGQSFWSSTIEAKLSHLDDLRRRLADAEIDAGALAGGTEDNQRIRSKARTKVLTQGLCPRDLTDAMRETPRQRLYERRCAAAGRASRSPRSRSTSVWRPVSVRGICRRVRRSASNAGSKPSATGCSRRPAKDPAAQRALLTWCYGTMGRCDDSYGVIGELAQEALIT